MNNKQFELAYKIFSLLLEISKDKRFKVETKYHYRKNEYVCEIEVTFTEYNAQFRDVAIIWFNDSDENTADEGHIDGVVEDIYSIVSKANSLTNSKLELPKQSIEK